MKKLLLFFAVLLISSNFTSANDDKFINALRNCSPSYNSSDTVNLGEIKAISTKSMSGWKNNICTYKEALKINGNDIVTICHFTKAQVNEIVSVADAYYLTLQYSNEKIDTSSLEAVKNNPLVNVMNKYLQDPSICTMGELE